MRADGAGELELGRIDIGRDHARGRDRAQQLDRHVAEAADADHDRAAARDELVERELDRVIRGERRVRERGGVARVEVAERHEQPRVGDQHVLRHAAVAAEAAARGAQLRRPLAQGLEGQAAGTAAAASPRAVDGDRLTDLEALDARSDGLDPAGVLVAERERQLVGQEPRRPLHHVQVGVTGSRAADLDEHLARSRLRHLDVPQLGRLLPLDELVRLHGRSGAPAGAGRGAGTGEQGRGDAVTLGGPHERAVRGEPRCRPRDKRARARPGRHTCVPRWK